MTTAELESLRVAAHVTYKAAEKAAYAYAIEVPDKTTREKAFEVYERLRFAGQVPLGT